MNRIDDLTTFESTSIFAHVLSMSCTQCMDEFYARKCEAQNLSNNNCEESIVVVVVVVDWDDHHKVLLL